MTRHVCAWCGAELRECIRSVGSVRVYWCSVCSKETQIAIGA